MEAIKFILIGDSGTGKSSIAQRYVDNCWNHSGLQTIGVEFHCKTIDIDGVRVKLQIWDTAGQDKFESLVRSYYRGAHVCAIVFDLTNPDSLNNLRLWHKKFRESSQAKVVIAVGNKRDLAVAIDWGEIDMVLEELGIDTYLEVSALTGEGVQTLFETCARQAWRTMDHPPRETIRLQGLLPPREKPGCCTIL